MEKRDFEACRDAKLQPATTEEMPDYIRDIQKMLTSQDRDFLAFLGIVFMAIPQFMFILMLVLNYRIMENGHPADI